MRDIKYRGKRVSDGKWVYGYYVYADVTKKHQIAVEVLDGCKHYYVYHEVIPETVGQYTGLKDKNGNEIYEGDILRTRASDPAYKPEMFYRVLFLLGSFDINNPFCCKACNEGLSSNGSLDELLTVHEDTAVIGNIHDNPELLKEIK